MRLTNDVTQRGRELAQEGLRMALLSLFSLLLGYGLTSGFTELAHLEPQAAYGISVLLCSIANFFGCRHFVFRGRAGPLWAEALRFFPSVFLFRAIEVALFSALFSIKPNYHFAYFVTAAISMAGKLVISKLFIFRR